MALTISPYQSSTREHDFYQELASTFGPAKDRHSGCVICLETMTEDEKTITHNDSKCMNAFHQNCFQSLITHAETQGKLRCPLCRIPILPWPEFQARSPIIDQEIDPIEAFLDSILENNYDFNSAFQSSSLSTSSSPPISPIYIVRSPSTTPLLSSNTNNLHTNGEDFNTIDVTGLLHSDITAPSSTTALLSNIWLQDHVISLSSILSFLSSPLSQRALLSPTTHPHLISLGIHPIDAVFPVHYTASLMTLYHNLDGVDITFPLQLDKLHQRWIFGRQLIALRDIVVRAVDGVLDVPIRNSNHDSMPHANETVTQLMQVTESNSLPNNTSIDMETTVASIDVDDIVDNVDMENSVGSVDTEDRNLAHLEIQRRRRRRPQQQQQQRQRQRSSVRRRLHDHYQQQAEGQRQSSQDHSAEHTAAGSGRLFRIESV